LEPAGAGPPLPGGASHESNPTAARAAHALTRLSPDE
jgi:hypothetical protein